MEKTKCRICRRLNTKLFLKGERCFSPKCAMVKKPYPPGQPPKRRLSPPTEYALLLKEKQKLKNWYNLSERQFRKYVKEILTKRKKTGEDLGKILIQKLEKRLDNVIYRLGFASSRDQARQLVSHSHFLVNEKPVNIPSFETKVGDVISVKPQKQKKKFFQELKEKLKNHKLVSWLELDLNNFKGKIKKEPNPEEVMPPVEISSIFEFYSK